VTRAALRARFHARPGHSDRFDSLTPEAMQGFITQLVGMISAVVVPITMISLVVGGIVIMNIMLVSVTERTHEIGVRKSVGARQIDIRRQFLIEAVILAGLGGTIGVALGASLTMLLAGLAGLTLTITGKIRRAGSDRLRDCGSRLGLVSGGASIPPGPD
jgi:putative ABC transport system permease protein